MLSYDFTQLDLHGFVTITNNSGRSYNNTTVKLTADKNRPRVEYLTDADVSEEYLKDTISLDRKKR